MDNETGSRTIKSVATATEIVEHLRRSRGGTISELADTLDISPASVHSHLATLKQKGYIVQHDNTYNLGPQLLTLGEYVRNHSNLYEASKEQVEQLANESGECAHLIIEHGGNLFALYERFGSNAVGIEYHDQKRESPLNHLHCTASGKAILAGLPEEEVSAIFEENGMPQNTEHTITDRDTLLKELSDVREQGYAVADEEQILGIRAIGASIKGTDGTVKGAISVSGPASRLQGDRFREELPKMVIDLANICEVNLQTATID